MTTFTVTGDWSSEGDISGTAVFFPQPLTAGAVVSTPITDGLLNTTLAVIDGNYLVTFSEATLNGSPMIVDGFSFGCPSTGGVDLNTISSNSPIFVTVPPALGTFTVSGDWSSQGNLSGVVLFLPQAPGSPVSAVISSGVMSATLPVITGSYLVVFANLVLNGAAGTISAFAFESPSQNTSVDLNTAPSPAPVFPVVTHPDLGNLTATGDWSSAGDVSGSVLFIPQPASAGSVVVAPISDGVVDATLPVIVGDYLVIFEDVTLNGGAQTINGFIFACSAQSTTIDLNTASSPPAVLQIFTAPSLGSFTVMGNWSSVGDISGMALFVPRPETAGASVVGTITSGALSVTLPVILGDYSVTFVGLTMNEASGSINSFAFSCPSADTVMDLNTSVSPPPVYTPDYFWPTIS